MKGDSPTKKIEVFVESMELASLQPYFRVPRYQHEVFRITTDNLSYVTSSKRFFPDKDREALSLVEDLDREKFNIIICDVSQGIFRKITALSRGIFRTPAILVKGKKLKGITKEELDLALNDVLS